MSGLDQSDPLILAKPTGPRCNLSCAYCYYLRKTSLFPQDAPLRLSDETLEEYVRQRLETTTGPTAHFEWHGGEPTLLGREFFERVVAIQQRYVLPGCEVTNGLQTNGTLIDSDWVEFLHTNRFAVGLSLDGPAPVHDAFRVNRTGAPSHAYALRALRLLLKAGVHTDVLCVLQAANVGRPQEVYRFFRNEGVRFLQFLPLVERLPGVQGGVSEQTPRPQDVGLFLCSVFDRWLSQDLGRMIVQTFDEAFRQACGMSHALCIFRETCGDVWVLEHDGSLYVCDHFVDEDHRLGSLEEPGLAKLRDSPLARTFGENKRDLLPRQCRECDVLSFCNGGCPKDRFLATSRGEPGLNYLCAGLRQFFQHARPALERLAIHTQCGRPLQEFRPQPVVSESKSRAAQRGRSKHRR